MTTVLAPAKPVLRKPDRQQSATEQDEGLELLRGWHANATDLHFVYARSGGGLMQSGRCRIEVLTAELLKLDAAGAKLAIDIGGAALDVGPQLFFSADLLSRADVHGVALKLANFDWLFLSEVAMPDGHSLPSLAGSRFG
jgi:hypothetical protein